MDSYEDAKERITKNQKIVLDFLISAGNRGVTNREIAISCGGNWSARKSELIEKGYIIENLDEKNGRYRYFLTGYKKKPKKEKNINLLENDINEVYGGSVTFEELEELLFIRRFYIQKKGSYPARLIMQQVAK